MAGSAAAVFVIFMLGRTLYGRSAQPRLRGAGLSPPAPGPAATAALAAIASPYGLGTIIGPAIAPLFIFEPLGLSAPMIVFAAIGALVLAALVLRLPDDTPRGPARGAIVAFATIGGGGDARVAEGERASARLEWRDPRVLPWHLIGIVGGHGQAAVLGVIGFLVIDRLGLPLDHAQQWIAIVMIAGAGASLLAQWWLIPQLGLDPRQLVVWGSTLSAAGASITGFSTEIYGITMGFACLARFRLLPARLPAALRSQSPRTSECGGGHGNLGQRRRLHRWTDPGRPLRNCAARPVRGDKPADAGPAAWTGFRFTPYRL